LKTVEIFADGGCRGNPGPGGYGVILKYNGHIKELSGGEKDTTNNKMELMGVIVAFEALKFPCKVLVFTDSNYVVKAFNDKWIEKWLKNKWRGSSGLVKNRELWERLLKAIEGHDITWTWVKGHSGHPENERCDELANLFMDKLQGKGV
jgi:ribonuclease HI